MIEKIQKYFKRLLYCRFYGNSPVPEYSVRLHEFSLQPLFDRYKKTDLLTLLIINGTHTLAGFNLRTVNPGHTEYYYLMLKLLFSKIHSFIDQ